MEKTSILEIEQQFRFLELVINKLNINISRLKTQPESLYIKTNINKNLNEIKRKCYKINKGLENVS